tara:strand:+ start:4228 stop:4677 length:450 start_codon:yes stop_codon:yes gene_type:complete
MIEIRRLEASEAELWVEAVSEIISPGAREERLISLTETEAVLKDDRCYLMVALESGDPVGLLNAYRFPDASAGGFLVYLYDIEVSPESRRCGIGKGLLELLIAQCESDKVKLIWAGTESTNFAARETFESTAAELEGDSYVEYEWDLED